MFLFLTISYAEMPVRNDIAELGSIKNSFSNFYTLHKTTTFRPSQPQTYISTEGHFKIHYSTTGNDAVPTEITNSDGVPDWIYYAAQYAERAYFVLVDSMGFDAPPPDGVDGDEYDIYFKEYNGSYYANTYPENDVETTSRPNDYTTYLVVDNDFVENSYETHGYEALRVTIAHEFFHMVQIGYNFDTSNYLSPMSAGDAFFFEWSSTWFEEFSYPEVNDYVAYAKNFMFAVDSPIWTYNGSFEYAQGIFMKYIIDTYSTDILIKSWNKIKNGERAFFAINDVIKDETNTTLAELYNEYCQKMYFAGSKYDPQLSVSEDAQFFPSMQIHWSDEYVFNSTLQVTDFIRQFTTQPLHVTFENYQNFGLLKDSKFSKELLGSYIFNKNGKYITAQFDLNSDEFIGKCSPGDTLILFLTNKDENQTIEFDIALDFVEPANLFAFTNLFPNPTDGSGNLNLTISTKSIDDEINIMIYNLIGQKIFSEKYLPNSENQYIISFQNDINYPLASGIYILQVESGNKSKTKKFTILK